ncbi:MAG: hypothetical protein ACKV0T_06245 [Planctomycetales bacterium]
MTAVLHRKKCFSLFGISALMIAIQIAEAPAAAALVSDAEVYIGFKRLCDGSAERLDLGHLYVALEDQSSGEGANMFANFLVSADARMSGICDCMSLHYLQVINSDDCPASYFGNKLPTMGSKVIDSPNGGWDYQYNNNDATHMSGVKPDHTDFVDTRPWYWNQSGEQKNTEWCDSYRMGDGPGYCTEPPNGKTFFTTYLVAESSALCDSPDCLKAGEILLLAAWDWSIQKANVPLGMDGNTLSTIGAPGGGDVLSVKDALAAGGFSGYSPKIDKNICCPEPASVALVLIGFLVGMPRRFRHRHCAA